MIGILTSFGGGAFGALVGILPSFVLCGLVVIVGSIFAMISGNDIILSNFAFRNFLGPNIAFTGGVAGLAYIVSNKESLTNDTDEIYSDITGTTISVSLHYKKDYKVVLIGGFFGVIGYLVNYFYSDILNLQTDTVAMSVVTVGIIVRLLFGKSGLFGICAREDLSWSNCKSCNRDIFPRKERLLYVLVVGISISILTTTLIQSIIDNYQIHENIINNLPNLLFGISAFSLIFAVMGFDTPATHQITLIAGIATLSSGSILIGIIFGTISNVLCEFANNLFNEQSDDSFIDPPAFAIFICMFVIKFLF